MVTRLMVPIWDIKVRVVGEPKARAVDVRAVSLKGKNVALLFSKGNGCCNCLTQSSQCCEEADDEY